jgi:hypothetical protein
MDWATRRYARGYRIGLLLLGNDLPCDYFRPMSNTMTIQSVITRILRYDVYCLKVGVKRFNLLRTLLLHSIYLIFANQTLYLQASV